MRFAVFTVSLPEYSPEEAVAKLREFGYEGVEWRVTDQESSTGDTPGFWSNNRCTWPLSTLIDDAPRIRTLTEEAGLELPNVGTYVTCDDLEAVEQAMRGVVRLGARQLRVNVPRYDPTASYLKLRETSLAQYRLVAEMAKQYGVRALVEIHHNSQLPSASAAASFLSHFDAHHVGAIHDAGNMVYEGYENYRLGLEMLGPYLAHVHVKNARWERAGTRPDGSTAWRAAWAPLAHGIVDMAALFSALHAIGYNGWVSCEDFSTEQPLDDRIRDNLAYLKQLAHPAR